MWSARAFYYGLGVATPFLLRQLRPLAKVTVKGGLLVSGHAQRLVTEARENLQDIASEAAEEVAGRTVVTPGEAVPPREAAQPPA